MTTKRSDMTVWACALVTGAILAAAAYGQLPPPVGPTSAPAEAAGATTEGAQAAGVSDKKLTDLWDNFIHGIKVARADLADSTGKAIIESGASPRDVYLLSVKERDIDWLLKRGEGLEGLKPVIDGIRRIIEEGYQSERSDPNQIANSIDMLATSLRAFEIGKSRLVTSGEYAMPQLIQKVMDRSTSATLRERIIAVLPAIGKEAVRPLSAAMQSKDENLLQMATDALGRIGYSEGAPALKELLERKDISQTTRQIAATALAACGGPTDVTKPVSSVLYAEAEKYYYRTEATAPAPGPTANVWFWQEGLGLTYTPVPREIFADIYAMRLAKRALSHDADFYPAVSLWLAARIRKEVDLPAGAKDPLEQPGQPSAQFYALAGSATYMQDVLDRAMRDGDSALALRAIEALAQTAGARSLVEPASGGVQPLVEALTNRDRQVRLLAALTLAHALPQKHFKGDEMVVVVFNEALRQVGRTRALLLAAGQEERNLLKDALRTAGYEVIDFADPDKAIAAAREAGGVDMVVVGSQPPPAAFVQRIRGEPLLASLPVVVVSSDESVQRLAKTDPAVVVVSKEADASKITEAIGEAAKLAGGGQTSEQQAAWAERAAGAVELLGQTGNTVYDLSGVLTPLVTALGDQRTEIATAAAKALAVLNHSEAQRALADKALASTAEPRTRVAVFELLSDSLRRFGNMLSDEQTSAVVAVVTDAEQKQDLRDAAAAAMGAMDLPSKKIQDLILTSGE